MTNNLVFGGNPWLIEINLSEKITDEFNKILTIEAIESDTKERELLDAFHYNTRMVDTENVKKLYKIFKDECYVWFRNIDKHLPRPQKTLACSYICTGKRYDSVWHRHTSKTTINGVYYTQIPDDSGTLSIMDDDGMEKKFLPLEKHLYLMPGWFLHKPNPCNDPDVPRVAINLEFLCLTRPILKEENFDIKEYENFDDGAYILW